MSDGEASRLTRVRRRERRHEGQDVTDEPFNPQLRLGAGGDIDSVHADVSHLRSKHPAPRGHGG